MEHDDWETRAAQAGFRCAAVAAAVAGEWAIVAVVTPDEIAVRGLVLRRRRGAGPRSVSQLPGHGVHHDPGPHSPPAHCPPRPLSSPGTRVTLRPR
jgi:hypothetical protein